MKKLLLSLILLISIQGLAQKDLSQKKLNKIFKQLTKAYNPEGNIIYIKYEQEEINKVANWFSKYKKNESLFRMWCNSLSADSTYILTPRIDLEYKSYKNGILHSIDDKPAVFKDFGEEQYFYKDGVLHRDNDKPAYINRDRIKYYVNGKLHRAHDNPASYTTNKYSRIVSPEYYKNGTKYTPQYVLDNKANEKKEAEKRIANQKARRAKEWKRKVTPFNKSIKYFETIIKEKYTAINVEKSLSNKYKISKVSDNWIRGNKLGQESRLMTSIVEFHKKYGMETLIYFEELNYKTKSKYSEDNMYKLGYNLVKSYRVRGKEIYRYSNIKKGITIEISYGGYITVSMKYSDSDRFIYYLRGA